MSTIGYARVSTREQNEERQIAALSGCDIVYMDKASGKDFERVQYRRMMRKARRGDTIVVLSLDRFGRNYDEIVEQWKRITKRGIDIAVMDMPLLDTRKGGDLLGRFISDLVLQILAYVAQTERDAIRTRQRQGIECAIRRGVRFGRPCRCLPDGFDGAVAMVEAGEITVIEAARKLGMSYGNFNYHRKRRETRSV